MEERVRVAAWWRGLALKVCYEGLMLYDGDVGAERIDDCLRGEVAGQRSPDGEVVLLAHCAWCGPVAKRDARHGARRVRGS